MSATHHTNGRWLLCSRLYKLDGDSIFNLFGTRALAMNVLLAVSDRLFGDALVRFASNHNWEAGSQFKLICVVAPLQKQFGHSDDDKKVSFDEEMTMADKLLSQLKTALQKALPGAAITYEVLVGSPSHEILECAGKWPAGMIVLGSHGRGGLEKLLIGSVSHFVASHSACSFGIVRVSNSDVLDFELEEEDIPAEMRMFS